MRFAICDDNEAFCEELEKYLREYFSTNKSACPEILVFHSGEEILACPKTLDIVFLDVEMSGLSGIHTGKELRKRNSRILYFIITSHADYLDEALHFQAFRYLSKPLDKQRLFRNLRDALHAYLSTAEKLGIETREGIHTVYSSDIIMIESRGKQVFVHTLQKDYLSVQKMKYWEAHVNPNCFFHTHRSYLVNLEHVSSFTKSLVYLCQGQFSAYLTVRKYTEFKRAYLLYLESMK
ncbi:MAG: LytTR family DNA-binding domain-containing protein [Roseburia sp.]|nr:LytTR family DNA-binding domain-containing protein [Roseburia sp.]